MREDAWLSGFVDGEGSFGIFRDVRHGNFRPELRVALRDDDGDILRQCHEAFSGWLEEHHVQRAPSQRAINAKPQVRWIVSGKVDLMRLVEYFDRFPLRTKKARDYVVWREAVLIYVEEGGKAAGLEQLKAELSAVREYHSPLRAVS